MPASGPVPLSVAPRASRPPAHPPVHPSNSADETSHSHLRHIPPVPQRPASVPAVPLHPRLPVDPSITPQNSIDMGSTDGTELLKNTSIYLDGHYQKSAAFDDGLDSEVVPVEPEGVAEVMLETKSKKKSSRASKAERLAAEQAVWVRDKFDLPTEENLVASFSAALVRHILLQGRIYITSSGICFYAKIFGRITKEHFPYTSIARVKKRRGGFVANAIKIYFADETVTPVVIASLNHRERAFKIIQDRLREVNPSAAEPRDGDDAGSAASLGPDSEDKSVDDDEFNTDAVNCSLANQPSSDGGIQPSIKSFKSNGLVTVRNNVNIRPAESDTMSEMSSRKSSDADPVSRVEPNVAPEPTPQLVWRTNDDVVGRVNGKEYEKRTERARGVLNAPVVEVFNVIFISDWLKHYHMASNNRDPTFTDWYRAPDGFMTRDVTFRRPLGYKIGPKETRVKERQRYSFTDNGGVLVELEGQNMDAPYGDYFVVESYFELSPIENGEKTQLVASLAVHFKKGTILRGKIESGALTETKTAFQRVIDLATKRIDEYVASKCQTNGGLPPIQPRKRFENPVPATAPPSSPSKKLRATEEVVIPPANICEPQFVAACAVPTTNSSIPWAANTADVAASATAGGVSASKTVTANIEVQDSLHSKWLRVLAIGALVLACILLLAVLILLYKMQRNISMLEKLVYEQHLRTLEKCVSEGGCAAATA